MGDFLGAEGLAFMESMFPLFITILLYFPSALLQDNPKVFPLQSGLTIKIFEFLETYY